MKLHFRSNDSTGSLPFQVTPPLINGSAAASATGSASVQTARPTDTSNTLLDATPSFNNADLTCYQSRHTSLPTSPTRCGLSIGARLTYLIVIALVFSLPFFLPIAITRTIRIADRAQGMFPDVRRTINSLSTGNGKTFKIRPTNQRGVPVSFNDTVRASDSLSVAESPGSGLNQVLIQEQRNGLAQSSEIFRQDSDYKPSRITSSVFGRAPAMTDNDKSELDDRPRLQLGAHDDRHFLSRTKPTPDAWVNHAVVRNGNLILSETFESRLNADISRHLSTIHEQIWGHSRHDCGGPAQVSFSFETSPSVEAEIEVATQCSSTGGSCTLTPKISDLRRLTVDVRLDDNSAHYLRAAATASNPAQSWGPLQGILKVRLLDTSIIALHRLCGNRDLSSTHILSISDLKKTLAQTTAVGTFITLMEDTFLYEGHPYKHIVTPEAQSATAGTNREFLGTRSRLASEQKVFEIPSSQRRPLTPTTSGVHETALKFGHSESVEGSKIPQQLSAENSRIFVQNTNGHLGGRTDGVNPAAFY